MLAFLYVFDARASSAWLSPCLSPYGQVNLLCQAASLLVTVKTQQFKREIAAKKAGGKSKAKRGSKDKKAVKQA